MSQEIKYAMKANAASKSNPWLYWFAVLTALATLALIGIGGLVTSHEAGMSVPDWPTSYGYNMFSVPDQTLEGRGTFSSTPTGCSLRLSA